MRIWSRPWPESWPICSAEHWHSSAPVVDQTINCLYSSSVSRCASHLAYKSAARRRCTHQFHKCICAALKAAAPSIVLLHFGLFWLFRSVRRDTMLALTQLQHFAAAGAVVLLLSITLVQSAPQLKQVDVSKFISCWPISVCLLIAERPYFYFRSLFSYITNTYPLLVLCNTNISCNVCYTI